MAGQPIARKHRKLLDKLGEPEVFAQLSMLSVRSFCKEIEGGPISPPRLYEWLDEDEGRRDRYQHTKKMKADFWVEESMEIVDECDGTSTSEVAKAKARSEIRRWAASKLNREQYGGDAAVQVNVATFGEDHLRALMAKGKRHVAEAGNTNIAGALTDGNAADELRAAIEVQEAEYEVLEDEDDDEKDQPSRGIL